MDIYFKYYLIKLQYPSNTDISLLYSRIIDGSTSLSSDQLYFVGTSKNYIKKSDSSEFMQVNSSGNFYRNTNPAGKEFRDILDGGKSSNDSKQFIGPIIGGESLIIPPGLDVQ